MGEWNIGIFIFPLLVVKNFRQSATVH